LARAPPRGYPLIDGNKRLGWLATVAFLDLNGLNADLSNGDAFGLVWEIAVTPCGVDAIAARLRTNA
jgi:death-on-curing protein